MTLRGRIQVKPFGKGTDGALLVVDRGDLWVISYRAEGPILALDGREVSARGRACDKQFEAIGGPHFDVASITPL